MLPISGTKGKPPMFSQGKGGGGREEGGGAAAMSYIKSSQNVNPSLSNRPTGAPCHAMPFLFFFLSSPFGVLSAPSKP